MSFFDSFAYFYTKGPYPQYSERMVELLPNVLARFDARPQTILDIACGEGTFAVAMAKKGLRVTGVDRSPQMLEFARERAERENAEVEFLRQDMRSLTFDDRFDLTTCWFDSLNYVLELEGIQKTFAGVYRALKKAGLFVFDMNTIYGLAVDWQREPCYIQQNSPEFFEIHFPSYDFEKRIAITSILGFVKEGDGWVRMDEEHKERGYTLEEIRQCSQAVGFQELACWGSLEVMSEPRPHSGRVWFVMQK
ncbi:MAG: class I SAM-dependent methyltransferase [Chloroflexi bacterium]|nr:class I SAM-dependent methyltransferase [Chloroflexota bacterium]